MRASSCASFPPELGDRHVHKPKETFYSLAIIVGVIFQHLA